MSPTELPELCELERIIHEGAAYLEARVLCQVVSGERCFPVYAITLGNPDPEIPAVGFFGGVHGLERIGAEILVAYLRSLVMRLQWDAMLHRQLESVRMVFMPIVNPGGMWQGTRSNPNGVDLMRNAPLDASERVPFLIGGQRISARLPWYRGPLNGPMEVESQAVCQVVKDELQGRKFSVSLDCHSGFGIKDRIWFPHAHTIQPIHHLPEIYALKEIFDQTNSSHRYIFEPQSRQYLAHGDLWDYLYRNAGTESTRSFLPLTLEMGSWEWVKKNPRQIFSRQGIFNPLIEHRLQRVLRRHIAWFDFLTRAACSHERWMPTSMERGSFQKRALKQWYGMRSS